MTEYICVRTRHGYDIAKFLKGDGTYYVVAENIKEDEVSAILDIFNSTVKL